MTKVIGNTTATPNPRPDWNQTDPAKADYIKNKPDLNSGLKYYGDAGIIPSPIEWFNLANFIEDTYMIYGLSDVWYNLEDDSKFDIVIPYETDGNEKIRVLVLDTLDINIRTVAIPNSINELIGEEIQNKSITIICPQGSKAEQFAKNNELNCVCTSVNSSIFNDIISNFDNYIEKSMLANGQKYYGNAGVHLSSPIEWFNFNISGNTVTITGMSSDWMALEDESKNEIVIPYEIDGNSVIGIGNNAFEWSDITSIKLPNNITSIGAAAFYGCVKLKSIELPNSITSIEPSTFSGCVKLTSIELPNSITSIGDFAFHSCVKLVNVNIPNNITSIQVGVFQGCTSLASINIPNSVTSIGEYSLDSTVTIICSKGSYAETYAKENGYNYEYDTVTPFDYISDLAIEDNILTVTKGDGSASELDLPIGGTNGSVIVDDVLSDTSENPVQNKAIKSVIDMIIDAKTPYGHTHKIVDLEDYVVDEVLDANSENPLQNKHIAYHISSLMAEDAALSLRVNQEIKDIDEKLAELEQKLDEDSDIVIDAELSDTSENPVQNKAITQLLNKHLYTYTTADASGVVIPLDANSITYVYGEYTENNSIEFAFSRNEERTNDIPEEIVLILDLSSFTENPSVMFPSIIKWFGGEPPEVESGKVYMFSFIYVKGISSPYYLGIGGEFI